MDHKPDKRLKKLVITPFIISRKLKHYFQTFSITVFTEHPLRSVVENLEAMGRVLKWATKTIWTQIRTEDSN